jgi:cytochrome c-type biogenesis protein
MAVISELGVVTAFAAGAVSFLSPCVLPLVPGYVSYIAGQNSGAESAARGKSWRTLGLSLCFVLGFSTIFIALGAGANVLRSSLNAYRVELNLAAGVVVILFGLFTMGLLRLPWLQREFRWQSQLAGRGPMSAYVLGLAFAFGWTPCIGPILGAILALAASADGASGLILLSVYSLGLGVPFIMAALFLSAFILRLKALRWAGRLLHLTAGGVMILMGVAMITGHLSLAAIWIMETFPFLAFIG